MDCKHLPNFLSFSRIFLSLFFGLSFNNLLNGNQNILPFLLFVLILITDYFDGKIAKITKNTTNNGALLDVSADMIFVLISYLVLVFNHFLHPLFIFVLIFKFVEFIITSNKMNDEKRLIFDFLGKNLSKFWMAFPGIICILYYLNVGYLAEIINIVAVVTTVFALISSFSRLINSRK